MRAFFAILKDSFREALDSKLFYVLLGFSLLLSLLCLSIGFRNRPFTKALEEVFKKHQWDAASVKIPEEGMEKFPKMNVPEVQSVEEEGEFILVSLKMEKLEEFYARILMQPLENPGNAASALDFKESDLTTLKGEEGFRRYLQWRLVLAGFIPVRIREVSQGEYTVRCQPMKGEFNTAGAQSITFFFGLTEAQLSGTSGRQIVLTLQTLLANNIAGQIGILIAIVVTAWFIPNMLKEGSVDLVLARPLPRWQILVSRYFGGLVFVGLNAMVLVGGTWAGLTIGTGFVHWGYLLSFVTIMLLFAIVYSISVLAGILFRNVVLSIVFSVGFWFVCSLIAKSKQAIDHPITNAIYPIPAALKTVVNVLYYIFPATSDLGLLNVHFMTLGEERAVVLANSGIDLSTVDFTGSIVSSLIFTVVVVAISAWIFHRKDY